MESLLKTVVPIAEERRSRAVQHTFLEKVGRLLLWVCDMGRNRDAINTAALIEDAYQADVEHVDADEVEDCLEPEVTEDTKYRVSLDEATPVEIYDYQQKVWAGCTDPEIALERTIPAPPSRKRARRIKKNKGLRFIRVLVDAARAEFGLPKPTEANRLVVQGFMNRFCKEWGVCNSHTTHNVSLALPMVFIPRDEDIVARALLSTRFARQREREGRNAQGEGWFNNRFGIGGKAGIRFAPK
ncbi:polymerase-associated protein [Furcraea necrotic streak virus]|nr:polymerase-associated protein [Furcraea necrotic streak virus]ACW84408.1 polymerase-associated protein [Furcraea necrotic streak virus]